MNCPNLWLPLPPKQRYWWSHMYQCWCWIDPEYNLPVKTSDGDWYYILPHLTTTTFIPA